MLPVDVPDPLSVSKPLAPAVLLRFAISLLLTVALTTLGLGLILAVIELGPVPTRWFLVVGGLVLTLGGFFGARALRTPST